MFADIPGLLPGMQAEQEVAVAGAKQAARSAHERLRRAIRSMTFAEARGSPASDDEQDLQEDRGVVAQARREDR